MISQIIHNVRAESVDGHKFLVAPITMIVPGVLAGSHGAFLYSLNELRRTADAWNGLPITWKHPFDSNLSGDFPAVWEKQGIGRLRNARVTDRLIADGWFDVERTARISPETLAALNGQKRIEVSTGLHIEILNQQGHDARGRYYIGVVRIKTPDHLAILGAEPGACSLQDGCGLNVEAVR